MVDIGLTLRETLTDKEMGRLSDTTTQVVKNRLKAIYRRTGIASRLELANRFMHEHPGFALERLSGHQESMRRVPHGQ